MISPSIMIVAGEPSGDHHAAAVIRTLCQEYPSLSCWGVGGPAMQALGFQSLLPFEEFNHIGYSDVIGHLPFFIRALSTLTDQMRHRRPKVVICVDFSGFNTPVMKAAHKLGIAVIWYIAPKIWVWKKKKHTANLARFASHVAVIFPFEEALFKHYLSHVSYVGNPLVESLRERQYHPLNPASFYLKSAQAIRFLLVPGSRISEVKNMLPVMVQTARLLKQRFAQIQTVISRCPHISQSLYDELIASENIKCSTQPLEELLSQSDLTLIKSGTSTLQAGLMGVPMVIVYKVPFLSSCMIRLLAPNLRFIGLPNIIAGQQIVPEIVQGAMRPDRCAAACADYIENAQHYQETTEKLAGLRRLFGDRSPSLELTAIIKRYL
ncbi:MAG: lipid-A-disaccharide synthase [Chitinivibrionales bacterium]|nr:lipid-A-disaccharide synthase [Chitinivibrionales bacterium]